MKRSQLSYDTDTANNYSAQLRELLLQNDQNSSTQKQWDFVKVAIETTVSKTIKEILKQKQYRLWNKEVKDLSEKQKDLRIQIQNCKQEEKIKELKKERNYVLHNIRRKNRETKEKHLDHLIQEIDNSKRDGGMFKAIKVLNRKQFTNPHVNDKDGKKVTSPTEIQNIITKHLKSKFRDECTEDIQPFSGQPRALNNPISEKEVRQSIKQLKNGRAPGEDNICNEYLKFAPEILNNQIAMIINKTFENHEDLDINNGILVALPKPGKPKGPPQNLRPVTLLNSIRTVLSTIALTRIKPAVEKYISCSQSGFRPNRSTSDVVWAHRWISAKVLNYADIEIDITGIDMSEAFDTIDRKQLLQLLTNLVTEDEKRIIQFLLSNTTLHVKISGANTEEPFLTNIGTPQGDSLSPVLFIIYLEQALKNVRSTLDSPSNTTEAHLPNEIV